MRETEKSQMTASQLLQQRLSGVLLHPTALPGGHGIGDVGKGARSFVDYLNQAKQAVWQVLPTGPTTSQDFHSPYNCTSAFAGNPLLISMDELVEAGLLEKKYLSAQGKVTPSSGKSSSKDKNERVNFEAVSAFKYSLLTDAANSFSGTRAETALANFKKEQP